VASQHIGQETIDSLGRSIDLDVVRGVGDIDALPAGARVGQAVTLTDEQSQAVLDEVVRLVADLPRKSTPDVVWTLGVNELLVATEETRITFGTGVVVITVVVSCDQVGGSINIPVPLGVGTGDAPAGLVMSAFDQLQGPSVITDLWTDAITAFAWECLIDVCRAVARNVGTDSRGRPLVPGLVSAGPKGLAVEAMARHTVTSRGVSRENSR